VLHPPRAYYQHGWGVNCSEAKPIVASWYLTVDDVYHKPTTLVFDMVEGTSPLIIGLDVKRFSNTNNIRDPSTINFERPTDSSRRTFLTYITKDANDNDRLKLELVTHVKSTYDSLMANIRNRPDINVAKKVHRFTHASAREMRSISLMQRFLHQVCHKHVKKYIIRVIYVLPAADRHI